MSEEERNIILFTGQSGINSEICLKKLQNKVVNAKIFKVEEKMKRISGKKFVEIIASPPLAQETLWREAFKVVKDSLPEPKRGEYVFLTFHASYYHQRKTEFVYPFDFMELQNLRDKTKMVIVFIDDCYDIYKRLMNDNEMYENIRKSDPSEALLYSSSNLTTILDWRQSEIAISRKISQSLEVPLYIIGVKHPSFMVSRLIVRPREELQIYYLSHPISDIRKEDEKSLRSSNFYMKLNEFIEEMLESDDIILFIPDAIDEKRIKQYKKTKEYVPELLNGWPLPYSRDWLFTPLPPKVECINPLNPKDFDFYGATKEIRSTISSGLKVLSEKIQAQINSRDRTLVEQSKDGIVVFQPYWAASSPGGVEEELKYNHILRTKYEEKNRRTVMITVDEDLGKLRINQLFTVLQNNLDSVDNPTKNKLEKLRADWLNTSEKLSEFYNISGKEEEIKKSLEKRLPEDYRFNERIRSETSLKSGEMLQKEEIREENWEKIFEQIQKDPFRGYIDKNRGDVYLIWSKNEYKQKLKEFVGILRNFKD